jgi:hypothetical protein
MVLGQLEFGKRVQSGCQFLELAFFFELPEVRSRNSVAREIAGAENPPLFCELQRGSEFG